MTEPAGGGGQGLRAWLPLGGMPVARHQLALALALGCQRIVCVAAGLNPALIELQHVAEAAGARFHVISGPAGLLGMVTTGDELIALADGLMVWPAAAQPLIAAGPGVLAQPAARGLAAGFERLDPDHASAGVLHLPGRLIERLAELPPDCDAFAALQRIALQAGLPRRSLPEGLAGSAQWLLLRDEAAAHAAEAQWIALYSAAEGADWPSRGAARWLARQFGPALLHAGSGAGVVAASSLVVALLALVAQWFGTPALAFATAALAGLGLQMARVLARIEARTRLAGPGLLERLLGGDWAIDAVLLALMVWAIPQLAGMKLFARSFAPLVLLGLVRLVPLAVPARWTVWLRDRVLLALGLGAAALAGLAPQAIAAAALVVLIAAVIAAGPRPPAES